MLPVAGWALAVLGGRLPRQALRALLAHRRRGRPLSWPRVERCELEIHLEPPTGTRDESRFRARAALELGGLTGRRFPLLLRADLRVRSARDGDGARVRAWRGVSLHERYFTEARAVWFDLRREPVSGHARLVLEYEGAAESGKLGPDWRGILFVGKEHARMSEQTVFYPLVPESADGPAVRSVQASVEVIAPAGFEVFVPLPLLDRRPEPGASGSEGSSERWRFGGREPAVLSIVAGRYHRTERTVGETSVTVLLFEREAHLADELAEEAGAALAFFGRAFGPSGARTLGVTEIRCRQEESYNWASQELVAFDYRALRAGVPTAKLAHEISHLWWGLRVKAAGAGERFLTEGLAEFSAWRYLAERHGPASERRAVAESRQRYAQALAAGATSCLREVEFDSDEYRVLAYDKGALVLRYLSGVLGEAALDAALRQYVRAGAGRPTTLDDLLTAIRDVSTTPVDLPWIDERGDSRVVLEEVAWLPGDGVLVGRLALEPVRREAAFDPGLWVELDLVDEHGSQRHRVHVAPRGTNFRIASRREPARVELDPDALLPLPAIHGPALAGSTVELALRATADRKSTTGHRSAPPT